jgi:hypothetical protein
MDDTVCMSIKYGKLVLHRYIKSDSQFRIFHPTIIIFIKHRILINCKQLLRQCSIILLFISFYLHTDKRLLVILKTNSLCGVTEYKPPNRNIEWLHGYQDTLSEWW